MQTLYSLMQSNSNHLLTNNLFEISNYISHFCISNGAKASHNRGWPTNTECRIKEEKKKRWSANQIPKCENANFNALDLVFMSSWWPSKWLILYHTYKVHNEISECLQWPVMSFINWLWLAFVIALCRTAPYAFCLAVWCNWSTPLVACKHN